MMSKVVKVGLGLITLAALWCATPQAEAQRRGGGRGGVGVYLGPGGVGVDYGRGGYYDGYRGGYYDRGYGRDGSWYGGRRYDRYPRYGETDVIVPATQTYESFYQDPSPPSNARVRVRVPDADAEVFFNGTATQQRGAERLFETPDLNNGNTHTYDIKARWRDANGEMVERTQSVNVQRGRESMVDFTRASQNERVPVTPNKRDRQEQVNPPIDQPPQR